MGTRLAWLQHVILSALFIHCYQLLKVLLRPREIGATEMYLSCLLALALSTLSFVNARIEPSEIALNVAKGLRLISLAEGVDPLWKTEAEVLKLLRSHIKFVS